MVPRISVLWILLEIETELDFQRLIILIRIRGKMVDFQSM